MSMLHRVAMPVLAAALAASVALSSWTAQPGGGAPSPSTGTRSAVAEKAAEEDSILRRIEWFYGQRRAGSEGRMAQKRLEGVNLTRRETRWSADVGVWIPRGPFSSSFGGWRFGKVAGRLSALAKDFTNNILYLGSASGGLWKSTDDGASWTPLFEGAGTQTIGAVALDPKSPSTVWVGTGENSAWCEDYFGIGLLRSKDGGDTWEPRNGTGTQTIGNMANFASVVVDPRSSDRVIVGGYYRDCQSGAVNAGGIYTTDDGGATWTNRLANAPVTRIVQDPSNPDILWAGVAYRGVYKSSDGGNTWTVQTASSLPVGSVGRIEVAVAPSSPSTVYALFESVGGSSQFWGTSDGGGSWTLMTSGQNACDGQCSYNMVVKVDYGDPKTIYRGTIHVFKSTNGGNTWTDLSNSWGPSQKVHQDTHVLLLDPQAPGTFYVGCDGGIWKSSDGGTSFTNLNANLSLTQFYGIGIHPTDNDIITGGAQDNSSLARTTSDVWDLQEVTGDGFLTFINPANPRVVYITSYPYPWDETALPNVYRSDSGLHGPFDVVTRAGSGIIPGDRINWVTPYTLDVNHPATLYLGTHRMYQSLDGGDHWAQVGPTDMAGGYDYLVSVHVARASGDYVYAGTTNGRAWRSVDGGTNWNEISSGLPDRWINDVEADPADPSRAFCAVSGFGTPHLYEFTGSGWEGRGAGLPDVPANAVLMPAASEVWVGNDVGVFRSTDRGATFTPMSQGMPLGLVITDLQFNPATRTVTAGTYGRGAWQYTLPNCAVACTASAPATALVNQGASFTGSATSTTCSGDPAFDWDFGDGSAHSAEVAPTHAYASAGTFQWKLAVTQQGASACYKAGSVVVSAVPPPDVTGLAKAGAPFRIKATGSNLQQGVQVFINGNPWTNLKWTSTSAIVLKGGAALKAAVPKGQVSSFRFVNPDGGSRILTWSW